MRPVRTFRLDECEYKAVKGFLEAYRSRSIENKGLLWVWEGDDSHCGAEGLKIELDKAKAVIMNLQNDIAVLRNKDGV